MMKPFGIPRVATWVSTLPSHSLMEILFSNHIQKYCDIIVFIILAPLSGKPKVNC